MFSKVFVLLFFVFVQASCSFRAKPQEGMSRVVFAYDSLSAMEKTDLPKYVYVFPPLLSNMNGKPVEKLIAVESTNGGISDWRTTSPESVHLRKKISSVLQYQGYEVVSFEDLTSVKRPYSVLVVSTFYTNLTPVRNQQGELLHQASLTLVKGSLFDEKLDPKSKKEIIQVNGSLKIPAGKKFLYPIEKSMSETFSWFGDNCSGSKILDLN